MIPLCVKCIQFQDGEKTNSLKASGMCSTPPRLLVRFGSPNHSSLFLSIFPCDYSLNIGAHKRQPGARRFSRRRLLTDAPLVSISSSLWVHSGKAIKEDGSTTVENKEPASGDAEVKTVPSEAPQMNGNESKA